MAHLQPRDQRHLWIRYQVEGYTKEIVHDFKQRLETIFRRQLGGARRSMIWRQFILALGLHTFEKMVEDGFSAYWLWSERVIPDKGDLSGYWIEISSDKDFLRSAPFYTYIKDSVRGCAIVTDDGMRGLSIVTRELPLIDMGELVKLNICMEVGDDWAWDYAPEIERLEEEIQGLRQDVRSLRGIVERSMMDQGRFSTWMVSCMTQLMKASRRTYQAFDQTFRGSYPVVFERHSRCRIDNASTSIAQHDKQQQDP
uniref:Uncharacterized protein n=1 Tax=Tanacetum cinerariifolium TaxID=118510 RepID=A0A6L2LB96_TANCI|nr:hypothetical protein [Tanacetum cinerariifolium]